MSELSENNPRVNSVEYLITEGLGYCCEWFFWALYAEHTAEQIALRLGVSADTVRRHRSWYGQGKFQCKHKSCLKEKVEVLHEKKTVGK